MTREELRQERRRTEGDERVRAWRRQQHRTLVAGAEGDPVAGADFVVTDGGPSALALRYEPGGPRVPVVVASGQGDGAEGILRQAAAAGVRIIQDGALTRALETTPEGSEIPPAQYDAVAALLRGEDGPSTVRTDAPAAP
jgi:flagellar biosynthetic protein FlhB